MEGGEKMVRRLTGPIAGVLLFLPTLAWAHREITEAPVPTYYYGGLQNPVSWGDMDASADGLLDPDSELEQHNVVIRLTEGGLDYIADILTGILSDRTLRNLIDALLRDALDRCTDTAVKYDIWDDEYNFLLEYPSGPTYDAAYQSCGQYGTEPSTHCFSNDILFEYIYGYDATGTWDEDINACISDGKGIASICLSIPLLNPGRGDTCINAVIWGQDLGIWLDKYWNTNSASRFQDVVTGNRILIDYDLDNIDVDLLADPGTDISATDECEGDNTAHTADDHLRFVLTLRNFEIALTFTTPLTGNWDWVCWFNKEYANDASVCDPDNADYDPELVIENYVNGRAYIRVPIVRIGAGVTLKGIFKDEAWDWDDNFDVVRSIGFELKYIDLAAGVQYDFVPIAETALTPACPALPYTIDGVTYNYCPEFHISQRFAKTLLWLDAILRFIAVDNFDITCTGNPAQVWDDCVAWYLRPSEAVSIKEYLEDVSAYHPLEEDELIAGDDRNKIFLDVAFTNDFWADSAGILIPMNISLDLHYVWWNSPATSIKDVRQSSFNDWVTSCVDLPAFAVAATSQIIKVPACDPAQGLANCGAFNYCECWNDSPYYNTACRYPDHTTEDFVFELTGISGPSGFENLAEGLYGYPSNVTYYFIGIGIHHNLLSRIIYEALADGLACVFIDEKTPLLGDYIGDYMKVGTFGFLIPELKNQYDDDSKMGIEIIPLYQNPGGASFPGSATVVPYVKTGGPTFTPVMSVYGYGNGTTRADLIEEFVENVTDTDYVMFPSSSTWFDTADIMVDVPFLDISLVVDTGGSVWKRVLGLTIGMKASVDLDLVPCVSPDCDYTRKWPSGGSTDYTEPLTNVYSPNPTTYARVIDMTLFVDPDVKYFVAYDDDALGLGGDEWEGILGNLLPVILNGLTGMKFRVAFDLAAWLQIPIAINIPYFGPEFGVAWDAPFGLQGSDGVGDYLEIFIQIEGQPTMAELARLIKNYTGSSLDISELMGEMGFSAPVAGIDGRGVIAPETEIVAISDPHALYTRIDFAGWNPTGSDSELKYSWRLDGGFWSLWTTRTYAVFTHLLEGTHTFEIRAKNREKYIDPTPAKISFRIDSLGPDIKFVGARDTYRTKSPEFTIVAKDMQAPAELIMVSWKVDDGDWTPYMPYLKARKFKVKVSEGEHTVKVRAKDDVGNISEVTHNFRVISTKSAFGCSVAGSGGLWIFALIAFIPLIRRLR